MLAHGFRHNARFPLKRQAGQPDEQYAMMNPAQPKHEFTKVLIRGHQNRSIAIGPRKDLVIRYPGFQFPHAYDSVTVATQAIRHWRVHTLVEEEVHAGAPLAGYTTSARRVFAA